MQIEYNVANLPHVIVAADGKRVTYSYLADGTKFRAVSDNGTSYVYTDALRWRIEGNSITPESFALSAGRAVYENGEWLMRFHITDHIGSVRAVTDGDGNLLATYDYTPYGELLSASDSIDAGGGYLFTGKESQKRLGVDELYDSHARFMNTKGRFLSIDPMAEKYCHLSPYSYCAADPVNLIDPDGRKIGIFVDNNGTIIGNDGKNDGKVFVIKISKKQEFKYSQNGSEYLTEEIDEARKYVEAYSGCTDAFSMKPDIYNYFVEIIGDKTIREKMVKVVSKDNGLRNYKEHNRKEYGGYIKDNDVKAVEPGELDAASINIPEGYTTFHSHPSGIIPSTNQVFVQFPSTNDFKIAKDRISYVFGRNDETVYIYNSKGILSIIPHKHFVKFKKQK